MTTEEYNSILDAIKRELKRLDVSPWIRPIKTIVDNFAGCPIDEDETLPEVEILVLLKNMKPDSNPDVIFYGFLREVEMLDCFSYRSFRDTEERRIYWDPLYCSFKDFENKGPTRTHNYQANTLYPAPDIIKAWFSLHMRLSFIAQ
ncbi:MAG: hypothetical protein L3J62_10020 [Gammaproteobacteria bacterium]|nr:hypothetical protein [Gammaproteobacteria bacterium]